jgi:quercetin dioxygenase-like cupin family protein
MNWRRWITGLSAAVLGLALAAGRPIWGGLTTQEEIVRRTSNSWNKPIRFPAKIPEVAANIIEFPPKTVGVRHMSHYTRYIYVLQGILTFDFDDGRTVDFPTGSLILSGSTWLTPKNNGMIPTKVLVIDQTEAGESNSVLEK